MLNREKLCCFTAGITHHQHLAEQPESVECYGTAATSELTREPLEAVRVDLDDGIVPDGDDVSCRLFLLFLLISSLPGCEFVEFRIIR